MSGTVGSPQIEFLQNSFKCSFIQDAICFYLFPSFSFLILGLRQLSDCVAELFISPAIKKVKRSS